MADRFSLGCGNFGGIGSAPAFFGHGESRDEAFELMDAAWEAGIRSFDTADAYGGGRSERWIGEWMRDRGRRPALTTKVFHSVAGDPGDRGLAPDRIRRQVAGSLERLGVDAIDLYLTHEPDPDTPLEDTLDALSRLQDEGAIRSFGLSNVGAADVEHAFALAPIACVQNSYSLLDRASEPVVERCAENGVAFAAFGPLSGGWLTGKYRRGESPPDGSRMTLRPEPYRHLDDERVYDGLEALQRAAAAHATALPALAFAWLLADERVTTIVLGARRPAQLHAPLAALDVRLLPAERDGLTALVQSQRR